MKSVTLKCHKCHTSFKVLEDEQFDHDCPNCGPDEQIKHWGCDAMGDEILVGDKIVEAPNGDVVLEDNLEDFLIELLGFTYKTAE
jgi:predicted RNA-binding Zn-ribbon protein involved in translation (DUF1610 family)